MVFKNLEEAVEELKRDPSRPVRAQVDDLDLKRRLPMPEEPKKRKGKGHDPRHGGYQGGGHGYEGNEEEFDDPEEHRRIENRRFEGGLPPTPELYARAREQWYRLSGSLSRPPMDPAPGDPGVGEGNPPGQAPPGGKKEGQ